MQYGISHSGIEACVSACFGPVQKGACKWRFWHVLLGGCVSASFDRTYDSLGSVLKMNDSKCAEAAFTDFVLDGRTRQAV